MSKYGSHLFRLPAYLSTTRHSLLRRSRPCAVFFVLMLIELVTSPIVAQPPDKSDGFGGLIAGNEFTVLVASSRLSNIAVDGQPDVVTESSEAMQIQYRIIGPDPSGSLIVRAIVYRVDHQPKNSIFSRLRITPIFLSVQPDGKVRTLNPAARDTLILNLANGDPTSMQVLKKCLSDETIAAWFSVPFWMCRTASSDSVPDNWERNHEVSLGTLGSLHLELDFHAETPENHFAKVAIAGDAHFRPLVLPDSQVLLLPFLANASVEIDEISGTGRIYVVSPDDEDAPVQRPEFESVEWSVRLHGEARLPLKKPSASSAVSNSVDDNARTQDASGKVGKVTFRQTQRHVWTLQRFSTGISEIFDRLQMTVPMEK